MTAPKTPVTPPGVEHNDLTIIAISPAGTYTVRIPGPDAIHRDYRIRWESFAPDLVFHLTNAESGESYRVGQDRARVGRWVCSCPAFEYRKRGEHHCKHTRAGRNLLALLEDLQTLLAYKPKEEAS